MRRRYERALLLILSALPLTLCFVRMSVADAGPAPRVLPGPEAVALLASIWLFLTVYLAEASIWVLRKMLNFEGWETFV